MTKHTPATPLPQTKPDGMTQGDWRDAALMALYTRLWPKLNTRARMMLLAGLAGFQRNVMEE